MEVEALLFAHPAIVNVNRANASAMQITREMATVRFIVVQFLSFKWVLSTFDTLKHGKDYGPFRLYLESLQWWSKFTERFNCIISAVVHRVLLRHKFDFGKIICLV